MGASPETGARQEQPAFTIRRFRREDSPVDFELAMALRTEVFVGEQNVPPDRELDEYEDECLHWLFLDSATCEPIAAARFRPYQEGCQMRPVAKLERIVVKKSLRGQKLGDKLMQDMLAYVRAEGFEQAILDAQTQVVGFYETFGFESEGDEFMDAGIPHYRMRLILRV